MMRLRAGICVVALYALPGCATTGGSKQHHDPDKESGPVGHGRYASEHIRTDDGGDQAIHILGDFRHVTLDVAPKALQPLRQLHVSVAGNDNHVFISVHSRAEVDRLIVASVGKRNQISVTVEDRGTIISSEAYITGTGDQLRIDGPGQFPCPVMRANPSARSALICHPATGIATTARLQDRP